MYIHALLKIMTSYNKLKQIATLFLHTFPIPLWNLVPQNLCKTHPPAYFIRSFVTVAIIQASNYSTPLASLM